MRGSVLLFCVSMLLCAAGCSRPGAGTPPATARPAAVDQFISRLSALPLDRRKAYAEAHKGTFQAAMTGADPRRRMMVQRLMSGR